MVVKTGKQEAARSELGLETTRCSHKDSTLPSRNSGSYSWNLSSPSQHA